MLLDKVIDRIVLPADELAAYTFASLPLALDKLNPHLGMRIALAMAARTQQRTIYAENGIETGGA